MKTTDKFVFFWQGIYSNWNPATFVMDGISFFNSEKAFMWLKAMFFGDTDTARLIVETESPKAAKDLGRLVKGYDDAKWNEVRLAMMCKAVYSKFSQDSALKATLLATGTRILVEASPYDKVWGIGMAENDAGVEDEANWKGLNLLGKALGIVRENLA